MVVLTVCPGCNKQMQVPEEALGTDVRCENCQHVFLALEHVPAPETGNVADVPATAITKTPGKAPLPMPSRPTPPKLDAEASPQGRPPARKSSGATALIVVLVVLLLVGLPVLLCVGAVGWLFLRSSQPPEPIAQFKEAAAPVEV